MPPVAHENRRERRGLGSGTMGNGCLLELGTVWPEGSPIGSGVDGWLGPGDVVELEVERLGVLRNTIE